MTTSRVLLLAVLFAGAAQAGVSQAQPKDLPWAVAALSGGGEWAVRLPQLLVRDWDSLPDHRLSDAEKTALRNGFVDATLRGLDQQMASLRLSLDRRALAGTLPTTEPAATLAQIAALELQKTQAPGLAAAEPPSTLAFRAVWAPNQDGLPWPSAPRAELLARTQAQYLVSGRVREVGGYLAVHWELYSAIEDRVLTTWEGRFAADEAPQRVAEAADTFRSFLLGRSWSGLSVSSSVAGASVVAQGVSHNLPWSSDNLEPGELRLIFRAPGREPETRAVTLLAESRATLAWETSQGSSKPIVLETEPEGVPLYLDSRYLGLSPQTVDRPLATARVRAQDPAWATAAWEIGPETDSPSRYVLQPPRALPSVPAKKDDFYLSLAAFSFSLTSSAFLGAWQGEQANLTTAYALSGASDGYAKAMDRYVWVTGAYAASVVLTSGVFVWMMFELGDYLGAAQDSLP